MSNLLDKPLLRDHDPAVATSVDVPLGQNAEASRHQIHLTVIPENSAGTITIKGIGRGATESNGLKPAIFDTRFDAINMALGNKIYVFYGLFNALRFEFAGFGASKKVSAVLVSQDADLLISGNGP